MDSIIIFVKNLAKGGAEKQAVLLARALCRDYETHVVVFDGDVIHDCYRPMLASADIDLHQLRGGFRDRVRQTERIFSGLKPRAVFSYLTGANVLAAYIGRRTGVNVVTGIRSASLPRLKLIADRYVTNKLATMTVSNSYSARESFVARGFQAARMSVIPNCFENISPLRHKTVSDTVTVITVGRFVPQKDYGTAIRSMALASARVPSLRFVIVGYGSLEDRIRRMVSDSGIEKITKILIDPPGIPALLGSADMYLSTSLFEGTSNSVMEAMNADLPVVATSVGDNPRLVTDGVNGHLCAAGDAEAIADAVVDLAQNPDKRVRMGAESKRMLAAMFSAGQFRENYIKLIKSLP